MNGREVEAKVAAELEELEKGRSAVFLDRDGTVIVEADYLSDPTGVTLIVGAERAIRRLRRGGFAVVLVTNQSGIARGLFGEADYHAVNARLLEVLKSGGASLDGTYHCSHHPDFSGPCDCRKPATALYLRAASELGLDLSRSFYIGDKPSDVEPARTLGGVGILVRTGYGRQSVDEVPENVPVVETIAEAADWILDRNPGDSLAR
jgi:D-glycero-D-manno-heptose 1,7-bisphosphate phosphatase